jgi:hypothetical protein
LEGIAVKEFLINQAHKWLIIAIVIDRAWNRLYPLFKETKGGRMLDPLAGLVERLETSLASLGALLDQLHALTPKIEQAAVDAQQLQQDAKAGMVGLPIQTQEPLPSGVKSESGVVVLAVIFIGLFALWLGAAIGRNVTQAKDAAFIERIVGK